MISTKMKEDAAKISSEIKKIATKMPLAFLNYTYLNEDAQVVLQRRNDQLDEIQDVKEFLKDNYIFSDVRWNCKKDFTDVDEQLKRYGVESKVLDDVPARNVSNNTSNKNYLTVESCFNGTMPSDTSVTKYRKHLNL